MATWCPDLSGDFAANLVGSAHDKFMALGVQTYNTAVNNLDAMDSISVDPVNFSVNFDFDGQLAAFQRPTRPTINDGDFVFQAPGMPGAAPIYLANPITFDPIPELEAIPPSLTFVPKPVTPLVSIPIAPAPPAELVMPIEPGYVLPDVPTFEQLNLPAAPSIVIPEFTATKPVFIPPPFNETWDFQPEAYTQVLLDRLVATLDPMLQSRSALPEAIEEAIFQKGRSRIEVETARTEDQAYNDFAARGFDMPQGMLNASLLDIRQGGQNRIAEFSRDAVIKQFEETLANLRFAVVQGAALEGVFVSLHQAEQAMLLQAAQFQRESAIAFLQARISIINAEVSVYQAEAQVFETRIRATLAAIEVYKAQIEGELAKGQINDQRVRLYEGMLRGVGVLADFYRNRIEAVKVQADAQRSVVDRYKAEVDAYDSRWRAHVAEWQGYTASVEGEGKKADLYKTLVEANTSRVDAVVKGNTLKLEAERLHQSEHGMQLQVYQAGLSRFDSLLRAETGRLAAVGQRADAIARIYTADAQVEGAASAATDRSFELGMSRARAEVDTQLQRAQLLIQQDNNLTNQLIEIAKAKASIASQLAASTMSAVNYSAGVSSSRSKGSSCSTNFTFQGETADAGI